MVACSPWAVRLLLPRVLNILSHKTEFEKILYEDPSPIDGFIVLPDFKWDCTTISQLYLVALIHASDVKSLRDLRKCHINLLKSIRREVARVSMEKWGVGHDSLRLFIHYQPSYCKRRKGDSYFHIVHFHPIRSSPRPCSCSRNGGLERDECCSCPPTGRCDIPREYLGQLGHGTALTTLQLETEAEGVFERMTLTYAITELHPLWDSLRRAQETF